MLSPTARLATAIAATVLLGTWLTACSSDEGPSPPPTPADSATPPGARAPAATARPATPTSTPRAPGRIVTPTPAAAIDLAASRAVADEVIAAVTSGDVDRLEALIRYQQVPCDGERSREGPPYPDCQGAALGTPVPAFAAGVCNAVWHRDARPMLERFVERAGPLYALLEGPRVTHEYHGLPFDEATWDVRVVFETHTTGELRGASALISGGKVELLILGCGPPNLVLAQSEENPPTVVRTGSAFVVPTPWPEQATVPLDAVTTPRGDRTGIAEIDRVLDAVERQDGEAIHALLQATPALCSFGRGIGLVPCEENEVEGDLVEVFPSGGGCHGSLPRPDFGAIATSLTSAEVELYAVGRFPHDPGRHLLLYQSTIDEQGGFTLTVHTGAIVGRGTYACATTPEQHASWLDIILRGPAWPEDATTPE